MVDNKPKEKVVDSIIVNVSRNNPQTARFIKLKLPYDLDWTDYYSYAEDDVDRRDVGRLLLQIIVTPISKPIGFINMTVQE